MATWGGDYFTTYAGARRMGLSRPRNGRTYIMYHGTSWWTAQKIMAKGFRPSNCGMLGQGVYLSRDPEKACRYPLDLPEHQKVVIKVKVNVGKVKKIDYKGHPLQKTWHDKGYDSAWVPANCGMVKSGLEEDCVWDPNRITWVTCITHTHTQCTMHHVQPWSFNLCGHPLRSGLTHISSTADREFLGVLLPNVCVCVCLLRFPTCVYVYSLTPATTTHIRPVTTRPRQSPLYTSPCLPPLPLPGWLTVCLPSTSTHPSPLPCFLTC
uniref:PARP catalytic domain-containing protein n=1 Tax=Hucho hucho TaxID=62062 RepID=A0A4W5R6W6_9TELE